MLFGLGDIRMRRVFIEQEETGVDRKRREHQRLNMLLGYCEAPNCRRQILLGYFGEDSPPCGNCDVCLDPKELTVGTAEAQHVLALIQSTGERYGAVHVIDVLRGVKTEKVVASRHDVLDVFGAGASRKKEEWQSIIRQLVASGFLDIEIGSYGGLTIADKGHALLRGECTFRYQAVSKQPAAQRKTREDNGVSVLDGDQSVLLANLKQLRLSIANKRRVPAYVIFSDRSLLDMAERRPHDLAAFAEVRGVGAAKLKDFGNMFLNVIRAESTMPRTDSAAQWEPTISNATDAA